MYLKNLFLFVIIFSLMAVPINFSNPVHNTSNTAATNSFNETAIPPLNIRLGGNNSSYPSIAQGTNGTVAVAYQKILLNHSYIFYSISRNEGRSFSSAMINNSANSSIPTIIYSNNIFYIAYNEEINNSYGLYLTQLFPNGTIGNAILIAKASNTAQKIWMDSSPNGTVYIAYSINGSLYLATYNGSVSYSLISTNAIANGLGVYGNYIYVLAETGNKDMNLFEYNLSSIGWQDIKINAGNITGMPSMAILQSGNILITWAGPGGIYLYNNSMLNSTVIFSSSNYLYENPHIAISKNEAVLTWAQSTNGSYWSIYTAISNNGVNYNQPLKTSMYNDSGIATLPLSIASSILPDGAPIVSWVGGNNNETSLYVASLNSFINITVKNTACGCLLQNSELTLNGSIYSHEYKITNGHAIIPVGPGNASLKISASYFSTYSGQIKINVSSLINMVVYLSLEVPKYTNETVIVNQVGTGFPIAGAIVNLSINNVIIYTQKTNVLGVAYFTNITPSTYVMTVFKNGYMENTSIVNTSIESTVYVSLYTTTPTYFGKLLIVVYNASTHDPVRNAIVYLNSSTISYIGATNSSGMLMFKNIKAGVYRIYVNATGYSNYTSVIGIKANITNVYDIGLIESTGRNSSIYSNIGNGNTIFSGNAGIVENALLAIIIVIVVIVSSAVGLASQYYSKKEKKSKKEKELIDYMDEL
ncbi:MAG: hypothetical protein ACP5MW_03905 [Thermoplasmata archaeon]